ncbi:MAG: hypothetical protein JWO53_193 [Chlamydiia bacterium]|nr:hypothetical protein [Chlamydiia bacterium]
MDLSMVPFPSTLPYIAKCHEVEAGLNQLLHSIQPIETSDVERVNQTIASIARGLLAESIVAAHDLFTLRESVQTLEAIDKRIEGKNWQSSGIVTASLFSIPRLMNLYRASDKLDVEPLRIAIQKQEDRLLMTKKFLFKDGRMIFFATPEKDAQDKVKEAIKRLGKEAEGISIIVPTTSDHEFTLITVKAVKDASLQEPTLLKVRITASQNIALVESRKEVKTIEELMECVSPGVPVFSLQMAMLREISKKYALEKMPKTVREASEWLNLLKKKEPKRCLFVVNQVATDTLTVVLQGERATKEFTVREDGLILGKSDCFLTVQNFENSYPVALSLNECLSSIELLQKRLQDDIERFMQFFAAKSKAQGISNCEEVEIHLLKAENRDACIVWNQLFYGIEDGVLTFSYRRHTDGKVFHYECFWKGGSIILNAFNAHPDKAFVVASFTTQEGMTKKTIYDAFETKGLGVYLDELENVKAKKEIYTLVKGALCPDQTALKDQTFPRSETHTQLPYVAIVTPPHATCENWQEITLIKYTPPSWVFGKWKSQEMHYMDHTSQCESGRFTSKNVKTGQPVTLQDLKAFIKDAVPAIL